MPLFRLHSMSLASHFLQVRQIKDLLAPDRVERWFLHKCWRPSSNIPGGSCFSCFEAGPSWTPQRRPSQSGGTFLDFSEKKNLIPNRIVCLFQVLPIAFSPEKPVVQKSLGHTATDFSKRPRGWWPEIDPSAHRRRSPGSPRSAGLG